MHGRLLMELRDVIATIPYISTTPLDMMDFGPYVVILQDGERVDDSSRRRRCENLEEETARVSGSSLVASRHRLFCFHCGVRGHIARNCRLKHKEVKCYNCNNFPFFSLLFVPF